jgi:uncharacterized protein (DUF1499 family)
MTLDPIPTVRPARWASRIAVFAVGLLLVTLVLHRFSAMPTPLALNLFVVGLGGAGLALLVGLVAAARIWITGDAGAGSAALGILLALAALGGPLTHVTIHYDRPWINDATTDATNPPAFVALAQRPAGANPVAYPGRAFAELQAKAYPDLRPLVLDRSVEEAFELAEEAVRRLRWRVVAEEPPMPPSAGKPAEAGIIEATEQTLFVGFTDDIVIRIEGGAKRSRIDARSASRYGGNDFGENAMRLRRLMAEIRGRAELTPSAAVAARTKERTPGAAARALLKRQKARDQQKAESRNAQGPAKPGAQRAPARKETPRL